MATVKNNTYEIQINNLTEKMKHLGNDECVDSPKVTLFGVQDCFLSFYPKGSFWCTQEGHCSLLFGCPGNVDVKLGMYVGKKTITSGEVKKLLCNEETNESLYGLHDFCDLEEVFDKEQDAIVVGVEFEELKWASEEDRESDKVVRVTID